MWHIQFLICSVKERPHKLLVLVNPVSGSSNGKKIYETTAAEVFKQAKIQTEVIGMLLLTFTKCDR